VYRRRRALIQAECALKDADRQGALWRRGEFTWPALLAELVVPEQGGGG
jgi:hypothetical protein